MSHNVFEAAQTSQNMKKWVITSRELIIEQEGKEGVHNDGAVGVTWRWKRNITPSLNFESPRFEQDQTKRGVWVDCGKTPLRWFTAVVGEGGEGRIVCEYVLLVHKTYRNSCWGNTSLVRVEGCDSPFFHGQFPYNIHRRGDHPRCRWYCRAHYEYRFGIVESGDLGLTEIDAFRNPDVSSVWGLDQRRRGWGLRQSD